MSRAWQTLWHPTLRIRIKRLGAPQLQVLFAYWAQKNQKPNSPTRFLRNKRSFSLIRPGVFFWQKRQWFMLPIGRTMKSVGVRPHQSPLKSRILGPQTIRRERSVNRKAGMIVLITFVFIFVWQPRLTMYSVEEALTVMGGIAALLILLLLPVIAFLLLWHGVRFVFLRLRG